MTLSTEQDHDVWLVVYDTFSKLLRNGRWKQWRCKWLMLLKGERWKQYLVTLSSGSTSVSLEEVNKFCFSKSSHSRFESGKLNRESSAAWYFKASCRLTCKPLPSLPSLLRRPRWLSRWSQCFSKTNRPTRCICTSNCLSAGVNAETSLICRFGTTRKCLNALPLRGLKQTTSSSSYSNVRLLNPMMSQKTQDEPKTPFRGRRKIKQKRSTNRLKGSAIPLPR